MLGKSKAISVTGREGPYGREMSSNICFVLMKAEIY
jgi:hypothetical protein